MEKILRSPLILSDKEGWAHIFPNAEAMCRWVEPVDVREDEYRVWDSTGRPVSLIADGAAVRAEGSQSPVDVEGARAACLAHIRLANPNVSAERLAALELMPLEQLIWEVAPRPHRGQPRSASSAGSVSVSRMKSVVQSVFGRRTS